MLTSDHEIHFSTGRRSKKAIKAGAPSSPELRRVPRVTKLMALAIRLDQLIRDGHVADQAELARLGYVTRARLTQIMNLLLLAPDIQEQVLFLPATECGRDLIAERQLRPIAATHCWRGQRKMWRLIQDVTGRGRI